MLQRKFFTAHICTRSVREFWRVCNVCSSELGRARVHFTPYLSNNQIDQCLYNCVTPFMCFTASPLHVQSGMWHSLSLSLSVLAPSSSCQRRGHVDPRERLESFRFACVVCEMQEIPPRYAVSYALCGCAINAMNALIRCIQ